ncbi:MAG: phosphoribosylformylglycinamidine synthase [Paludibacteraceae bacterium]|nr:phosphoribosylformylglycinamidine synthase [Paludibacteraceae bacterium]
MKANRIFVEKKPLFRVEAESLMNELNENLALGLTSLRLINVYDLFGFTEELLDKCRYGVFGERVTDTVTDNIELTDCQYIAVESVPGQFDQRASSAIDCVHLIDPTAEIDIKSSRLLVFDASVTEEQLNSIRRYYINAVECREKDLGQLTNETDATIREMKELTGFIEMTTDEQLNDFCREWGLAMNTDDLREVVNYFKKECRQPTETELRILDTYWSDHCRHTTFTTELRQIRNMPSYCKKSVDVAWSIYEKMRRELNRDDKPVTLMDVATIGAKYLKHKGLLNDLEESDENNACSIYVDVDENGVTSKWLLQFKNETHNHPTEIEPFGGASTCLGGAIRDPLSGRAYVYQAMRVTGAGDITKPVSETLKGKLPQRVISRKAAQGYSSYGNQIGLAATHVREIYDDGYVAKRMEVGAVVGAVPVSQVRREKPEAGDIVLLLGGRTGRDGIGGATGASKEHTAKSLDTCGSEVQKGNAPEERKLQRLFRRPEVTRLIKKSNDFGAGGVSVAIGELADGLDIWLDRVPVKYAGLNPTELAISESQERMAVVIEHKDKEQFMHYCQIENVEVTHVANVTDSGRMCIYYKDVPVCDMSREFIDSAGAKHYAKASIGGLRHLHWWHMSQEKCTLEEHLRRVLSLPNARVEKGMIEQFDSTIGRSTVLMPFGGKTQLTESQVSLQKLPTKGLTHTASLLAYGYRPDLKDNPYYSAQYAMIEAISKAVAAGADWHRMRFSFQEYFRRMTSDPMTYGMPLAALLGALRMQYELELPAIGGKDSMSGTFEDLHVPPTLIAFGVTTMDARLAVSPEFKQAGDYVYVCLHKSPLDEDDAPNLPALKSMWDMINGLNKQGLIHSAWAVGQGGVIEGIVKCSMGNNIGIRTRCDRKYIFDNHTGTLLFTSPKDLRGMSTQFHLIGRTTAEKDIVISGEKVDRDQLWRMMTGEYDKLYPLTAEPSHKDMLPEGVTEYTANKEVFRYEGERVEHPRVYIPVFPGTNCDYDSAKAFRQAGADVETVVFRNLTPDDVQQSIREMAEHINACHILMLAGGFSSGDEPDGSGKFIASCLNNRLVSAAIERLIARGGLILGICNGFQALVKSGLLPYGRFGQVREDSPTLFRNDINRHVSQMVTTIVTSVSSPWLQGMKVGDMHTIAVSHGEGKLVLTKEEAKRLFENSQVAFRYAEPETGEATMQSPYNPNGSYYAIEGIISPNGQILGKMGHSERYEEDLFVNISGNRYQPLFANAVRYFRKEQ